MYSTTIPPTRRLGAANSYYNLMGQLTAVPLEPAWEAFTRSMALRAFYARSDYARSEHPSNRGDIHQHFGCQLLRLPLFSFSDRSCSEKSSSMQLSLYSLLLRSATLILSLPHYSDALAPVKRSFRIAIAYS